MGKVVAARDLNVDKQRKWTTRTRPHVHAYGEAGRAKGRLHGAMARLRRGSKVSLHVKQH